MLIDRGHEVSWRDYLYEYCLKENLSGKHVLDYGFNNGNLLRSIPSDVNFTYTGVEVQEDFVTSMSAKYPEHNFIHFNKYHHSYNFNGNKKIKLQDTVFEKYDIIFAWNVFTHSTYEYTKECLEEMRAVLNTNGKIVFNVYSKEHLLCLSDIMTNRKNRGKLINGEHIPITNINSFDNYAYWLNGETFLYDRPIDGNYSNLFSCYDIDWLDSENSNWTLRDNFKNRVYTFTTGA